MNYISPSFGGPQLNIGNDPGENGIAFNEWERVVLMIPIKSGFGHVSKVSMLEVEILAPIRNDLIRQTRSVPISIYSLETRPYPTG
jgi:hypothetical protein